MEQSMNLAEALPAEINRVRALQDQFKQLRGMRNVIVEPQIAMMDADLQEAIIASAQGDVVAMLRAHNALQKWEGPAMTQDPAAIVRIANDLSGEAKASLRDGCSCGAADELEAFGLWKPVPGERGYYTVTPLGLSVRQILEE